jgi:uncharacterized membrane protein YdjX (TVP38/TMEM64 family)
MLPIGPWMIDLAADARAAGLVGIGLFIAAYVVSTATLLPGALLTMAAGFAYGPWWGLVLASPASVAGATCAFLLGRTLLRQWVVSAMGSSPRARAIDAAVDREGFKLVMLLRLSPVVPFNALNYALSLSSVRLGTYVSASFLGMLPATAFYAYLGSIAPAAAGLASVASDRSTMGVAVYVLGFAATIAAVTVATRLARRALASELETPV